MRFINAGLKIVLLIFFTVSNSISLSAIPEYVELPDPQVTGGKPLMEALYERSSGRDYKSDDIPHQVMSNLLWSAFGVNRPESGKRTAPSAMNKQEIDIYVATKNSLFLYDFTQHALRVISEKDIRRFAGTQDFVQKAPLCLIYVADFERMSGSIEEKTFYSAIDTGYISQNVYLFCSSEGLSTVAVGWIDKPALAKAMELRDTQKIILVQPVGYPAQP